MTEIADDPHRQATSYPNTRRKRRRILKSYVAVVRERERLPGNRLASIIKLKELKSQSENRRHLKNARPPPLPRL